MNRDLAFMSEQFVSYELPKEKKYLLKYFTSDIQIAFLKYYFAFDDIVHFTDHTGHYCQLRWLRLLLKKLRKIEAAHRKAKDEIDLETLVKIEAGKMKCGN